MAQIIDFPMAKIFQLKISLKEVDPMIWRTIQVSSMVKLPELHKILQTTMGWTNSHLHQFIIESKLYAEPDEDSSLDDIDYTNIILGQVLTQEDQNIIYEYDFGDGWEHVITLEKIITEKPQKYPSCLNGKRNCPPEDCGGPYGYMDLQSVIANPEHEEYEDMIEWLGDDFDPEYFDLGEINKLLKKKDYGCITMI